MLERSTKRRRVRERACRDSTPFHAAAVRPILPIVKRIALALAAWIAPVAIGCLPDPKYNVATDPAVGAPPAPFPSVWPRWKPRADCPRGVSVVSSTQANGRRYRVVSQTSVTCGMAFGADCEERLVERACELGADAVVLSDDERGPKPMHDPTRSGLLVRWDDGDAGGDSPE
jgi:hypothetical protein